MYSYTVAGLPAAKRLQVNQTLYWETTNNGLQHTTATANLDSTYSYNSEGEMTAMTYPTTTNDSFANCSCNYNGGATGPGTYPGASYNYSYDSMYRLNGMTTSGGTTVVRTRPTKCSPAWTRAATTCSASSPALPRPAST
jgi:hypothetical protein